MKPNPVLELQSLGQSIWIDFISRGIISSGELQRMIEADGVSGVTSNPSIFEKAVTNSQDYDEWIRTLTLQKKTTDETYQYLTVQDIQMVADLLRPTYDRTDGKDGFVSLEVSPGLAHDTQATIQEARLLWSLVKRPNSMIKVPATREGIPAIKQLTGEGINVNITLLFGLPRYQEVVNAYLEGLEILASNGGNLKHVASVASFFLSRIDVLIDPLLKEKTLLDLKGEVAIASAKKAYEIYKKIFNSDRFKNLETKAAKRQRVLWASTSTKDPSFSDVKYIEALIGPETINTVPLETLKAFNDHGKPGNNLENDMDKATGVLAQLIARDIDINVITQKLEDEGIEKFNIAYDKLLKAIDQKQMVL